ncbi:MAG: glycosyltransferase family 4 protein [Phycisphaeraceae bacterium]|nr:glycosyltransferase family 4 protein [Phycisphaeraceae bacterium]
MHAALIADKRWLDDELGMFQSLVVGLLDEQARVAQVVPEDLPEDQASAFGERLNYRDSDWMPARWLRLYRLRHALIECEVDLLHALDGRLWTPVASLALRMDRPAVFTLNDETDLSRVRRIRRRMGSLSHAFTASTEPLANAIRQQIGDEVTLIPHGLRLSTSADESETSPAEDTTFCATISGAGHPDEDFRSMLVALQRIASGRHREARFFIDSRNVDSKRIWDLIGHYNLREQVSLIPRRLGDRKLLLESDAIIHPQALGRSRSVLLEAMGAGKPVVARRDPWLDCLVDDQTAWCIDGPDPDAWERAIRRLIDQPDATRRLGDSARAWVKEHHLLSTSVARTLRVYQNVTGASLPFPETAGA